jgi:hypothetical protein
MIANPPTSQNCEKKKPTGTQETKYKYLEIYVFFSFLAIDTSAFLGYPPPHLGWRF